MHGLIFAELKKYVEHKFNAETWETLLEKAGLKHNMYLASTVYPDQHALALVATASQMTGLDANAILEDFGEFIAPDLMKQYEFLVKPEWTLLDFLQNTEETIHKVVRFHKGAAPPKLTAHRSSPEELVISYSSARKMCALLKGIVKGAAKHYSQAVTIKETNCMLRGDPACVVAIRVAAASQTRNLPLRVSA